MQANRACVSLAQGTVLVQYIHGSWENVPCSEEFWWHALAFFSVWDDVHYFIVDDCSIRRPAFWARLYIKPVSPWCTETSGFVSVFCGVPRVRSFLPSTPFFLFVSSFLQSRLFFYNPGLSCHSFWNFGICFDTRYNYIHSIYRCTIYQTFIIQGLLESSIKITI